MAAELVKRCQTARWSNSSTSPVRRFSRPNGFDADHSHLIFEKDRQVVATRTQKMGGLLARFSSRLRNAMLITCHWSATGPQPITDYHIEYALVRPIPSDIASNLAQGSELSVGDVERLVAAFDIWKFMGFDQIPAYATYHLNHDPRDGQTANVSVAALCMGGQGVQTSGPWGRWPFNMAHAYVMAAIAARICQIKGVDALDSFSDAAATYSRQMNGPIQVIATHGERAYQTPNPGVAHAERGYFLYSGDPDCRWDIASLRVEDAGDLSAFDSALARARASGAWIRNHAHALKQAGIKNFYGLDKDAVPIP